jgi:endoglucanase
MLLKNCFAALAVVATAVAAPTEQKRQSSTRKLQWFGINESGAEFGDKNYTGVYGTAYTWYDLPTYDVSIVSHTLPVHLVHSHSPDHRLTFPY